MSVNHFSTIYGSFTIAENSKALGLHEVGIGPPKVYFVAFVKSFPKMYITWHPQSKTN